MRLGVRIRAIKSTGIPVLLVVLLVVTSLGLAVGDPGAWGSSGGWANGHDAAPVAVSGGPGDHDPGFMAAQRQVSDLNCGPTVTCLPVLLLAGSLLFGIAADPDRNIDLPHQLVDLWRSRPMAPVPIA